MPLQKVDKKYTGCNLKTTELLDCALIGVCAVIRLNTVLCVLERKIRLDFRICLHSALVTDFNM